MGPVFRYQNALGISWIPPGYSQRNCACPLSRNKVRSLRQALQAPSNHQTYPLSAISASHEPGIGVCKVLHIAHLLGPRASRRFPPEAVADANRGHKLGMSEWFDVHHAWRAFPTASTSLLAQQRKRTHEKSTPITPKTRTFDKGLRCYFSMSSVSKMILNCSPLPPLPNSTECHWAKPDFTMGQLQNGLAEASIFGLVHWLGPKSVPSNHRWHQWYPCCGYKYVYTDQATSRLIVDE